jgi:hypothetical protein
MNEAPIYTSKCTVKSLWHEYRIYDDRVELETGLGPMKVPFQNVQSVELSPPLASRDGIRLHFHPFKWGIKLDWADLTNHVMLDKDTGLFHRVDFTPEDPAAFRSALMDAMQRFRDRSEPPTP